MVCFDRVVVIFNPQSNGDAPKLAEELQLNWPDGYLA